MDLSLSCDLQTDCAEVEQSREPTMDQEMTNRLRKASKHMQSQQQQDSGIYSYESLSYRSTDRLADDDEGFSKSTDCNDVDMELGNKISTMRIGEPEVTDCGYQKSPVCNLEEDDGYESKSLSYGGSKSYDETKVVGIQEGQVIPLSQPSQEAIEAYSQDDDGDTHLHMALIHLEEAIAQQLINLAHKFDWVNVINNLLQTPLHLAVLTSQPKLVRRLLVAGATVDCRDLHGNTPLHIAAREGLVDCVEHLVTPITYAETHQNKYEIPFQKIPQDLEIKNYDGHAPLHLAALGSHIKTIEILLSNRANINAQDGKSGRTILHYAAETGNRILLEFLLNQKNIDLNCCSYGGLTPVVLAAGRRFGDIVSILESRGADCSGLLDDSDEEEMIDDFCLAGMPLPAT